MKRWETAKMVAYESYLGSSIPIVGKRIKLIYLLIRCRSYRSAFDVVFAVLLVFNAIGVLANILVMLGIKLNKRSLLLPWLVFQLMVILGE